MRGIRIHSIFGLGAALSFVLTSIASASVVRLDPLICTPKPGEITTIRTIRLVGIDPAGRNLNLPILIDQNRPSPAQAQITLQNGSVSGSLVNASVLELIGRDRYEIRYHFDFPPAPGMGVQSSIVLGASANPHFILEGSFSSWKRGAHPPRPIEIQCTALPQLPAPGPQPGPGMGGHN